MRVMSNSGGPSGSWTRCICSVCSGHLEFDSDLAGETIQCPHCGMPTILFIPRIPLPTPAGRSANAKPVLCSDCGTPVDNAARACVGCGRVIERPAINSLGELPVPAAVLSPTAAGAWLILAVLLVVVVGGPVYWWRSQFVQVPTETERQLKSRLQTEAEVEMLKETTNVIVGLTRIIHSSLQTLIDNPYKWTGEVTAEFVNRVGGVERTNVYFKFGTDTGTDGLVHLWCGSESELDRKSRQHEKRNR